MRTHLTHLIAAIFFTAVFAFLYLDRDARLKNYESATVSQLESTADRPTDIIINKISAHGQTAKEFSESLLSSDFVSEKNGDLNSTIRKVNTSVSKDIFLKLDKYKPFFAATRVEGRDFVVTFIPIGAYGYRVYYFADDTVSSINRKFDEHIFLLVISILLLKAVVMYVASTSRKNQRGG